MTCPNRDGTLDTRGCIFCSRGGSGDFAISNKKISSRNFFIRNFSAEEKSMEQQLAEGIALFGSKKTGQHFIAYFQAYTNTYAPVDHLEKVYRAALDHPDVCGISIATRPDCIPEEVLILLTKLRESYPGKFIWIELGLQTIHERTAAFIRRGYPLSCFEECFCRLKGNGFPVIVHLILGLPGEDREKTLETIAYLNRLAPFGIKLQLLHVLKDTDLARYYKCGAFEVLSKEDYISLVADCITHLSPEIVIHRVTGDGPKELLIAPDWSRNKRDVLNSLHKKMREEGLYQGQNFI